MGKKTSQIRTSTDGMVSARKLLYASAELQVSIQRLPRSWVQMVIPFNLPSSKPIGKSFFSGGVFTPGVDCEGCFLGTSPCLHAAMQRQWTFHQGLYSLFHYAYSSDNAEKPNQNSMDVTTKKIHSKSRLNSHISTFLAENTVVSM